MTRLTNSGAPAPALRVAMLAADTCAAETRVRRHAECLAAAGYAVTVFSLAAPDLPDQEQVEGVRYVRLQGRSGRNRNHGRLGKFKASIAPFIQHELHVSTFAEAVAVSLPDVVHAHGFETLPAAIRAAGLCDARVIYDVGDSMPSAGTLLARWTSALERIALRRVAATTAACPAVARRKASEHAIPQPTVVFDDPASEQQAQRLRQVYSAVGRGPRGLPASMARRALATAALQP